MIVCPVCRTFQAVTDDTVERGKKEAYLHTCRCGRTRLSTMCFMFTTYSDSRPSEYVVVSHRDEPDPKPVLVSRGMGRPADADDVERLVHKSMADEVLGS